VVGLFTLGAAYPVPTIPHKPASVAYVMDADGGHGSGVWISPRQLITARHVVEGFPPEGIIVRDETGGIYHVTQMQISDTTDFALLTLEKDANVETSAVDCTRPALLTQLRVVGFPLDL